MTVREVADLFVTAWAAERHGQRLRRGSTQSMKRECSHRFVTGAS